MKGKKFSFAKLWEWFLVVLTAFLMVVVLPVKASAQMSSQDLSRAAASNALYYDPYGDNCTVASLTGANVTWIGDSYSEGAELAGLGGGLISEKLPGVDLGDFDKQGQSGGQPAGAYIKGSKFVESGNASNPSGIEILESIKEAGKLRAYLVFALGNNGGITKEQIKKIVEVAGDDTQIVIANLYMTSRDAATQAYIASSNEVLQEAEKEYQNIHVADWAAIAKDEYYAGDASGVHPFGGYKEWVGVIYDALLAAGTSGMNAGSAGRGTNKNYAGEQVWTDEQLKVIEQNKSTYEAAAKETGVPWQAIAVVHSLETNLLRVNPGNGQGIYQMYSYTGGGSNERAFLPVGAVDEAEFLRQTKIAAGEMKRIIEAQGLEVGSDDGIKALLFQYNGKAGQYIEKALALGFTEREANLGEGSPYVMNRYDARRDPNSGGMSPLWPGRFVADGVYDATATQYDFGGFVKYVALGGGNGGGYCTAQGGNMDLNETAIELAWPEAESYKSATQATDAYITAMKESGIWAEADPDGDGIWNMAPRPMGKSCDMFVGTVVRYSGIDEKFPYTLGAQKEYLASSDQWEELNITDSSQYRSGDIRIEYEGGHISIVTEVNGELKIASASAFERYGDIGSFYINGSLTYRLKNGKHN